MFCKNENKKYIKLFREGININDSLENFWDKNLGSRDSVTVEICHF